MKTMSKYEKLSVLLNMHNTAFNKEYGNYDRYLYNINEPLSNEKINELLKKLDVKKLPADYVWMLKKYGYISIFGMDVLGYYNVDDNFAVATLNAENGTGEDYVFGNVLNKDYIVIVHDGGSELTKDVVLNVNNGCVYFWDYQDNIYSAYSNFNSETLFIDFLIDIAYSDLTDLFKIDTVELDKLLK